MLRIDQNVGDRVIVVSPDGPLTQADIGKLSDAIHGMTSYGGKVRGILIHAEGFPGWVSLSALTAHLRMVRSHHRKIERIAVASNSPFLRALPRIARAFLAPSVRVFGFDDVEQARSCAADVHR